MFAGQMWIPGSTFGLLLRSAGSYLDKLVYSASNIFDTGAHIKIHYLYSTLKDASCYLGVSKLWLPNAKVLILLP